MRPEEVAALGKTGDPDPRWKGIFWVCRADRCAPTIREGWPSEFWFERGGLLFYSADPTALEDARRCCSAVGL
jgi:hypothetical protein